MPSMKPKISNRTQMDPKMRKRFEKAKKNIDKSFQYFKPNYDRFNKFVQMTFVSTLTANEKMFLLAKNRPLMEFNIMEPYISRLRGEFVKSQFDIKCGGKDGKEAEVELIDFIEGHMRHIFHEMKVKGTQYDLITDTLVGGYSGAKVYTDYNGEKSFHQDIFVKPVWDPTLFGFDILAKEQDKNDGSFFWEGYPQNKDQFKKDYPNIDIDTIAQSNSYGSLQWSYRSEQEDVILLVDYYFKKHQRKKLVMLSNGETMLMDDYKEFSKIWYERELIGEELRQKPRIIDERMTTVTKIWRYKMVGTQILEEEETDLCCFPYVFIDGNSRLIKNPDNSHVQYMTRPYVYNAVAAQKLKNFAGQSLAYGMMKMVQSPFMASIDNLRGQDAEPWRNPQDADILTYNAFKDDNPEQPLQPPIQLTPSPLPPEIMSAFESADAVMQNVLGSFDASMSKLTEHEMSGVAYSEMQTMSNSAAKPYVESMKRGCQSIAEKILKLIPMTYSTPRSVPVMDAQGRKTYVKINQEGGISMNFEPDDLEIKIEAGPSFGVQQSRALQAFNATAKAFPGFAEFMHAKGLDIIVDNLQDIRGSDELKLRADAYTEELAEMQAMMAQQPNPEQMKTELAEKKLMMESQLAEQKMLMEDKAAKIKALTDIGKIKIDKEKNKVEMIKAFAEINQGRKDSMLEEDKLEYEKLLAGLEMMHERLQIDYDEMERNFQRAVTKHEMNKPEKVVKNSV
jgi:hypothetical protein